jgi:hypothetical protein
MKVATKRRNRAQTQLWLMANIFCAFGSLLWLGSNFAEAAFEEAALTVIGD